MLFCQILCHLIKYSIFCHELRLCRDGFTTKRQVVMPGGTQKIGQAVESIKWTNLSNYISVEFVFLERGDYASFRKIWSAEKGFMSTAEKSYASTATFL